MLKDPGFWMLVSFVVFYVAAACFTATIPAAQRRRAGMIDLRRG